MDGNRRSNAVLAEPAAAKDAANPAHEPAERADETWTSALQLVAGLVGVAALVTMVYGARILARQRRPTLFDPKTKTPNYALLS